MMDWSAFALSMQLAFSTLAVLLPLGLLAGRWLARTSYKGRTWIEAAILLPLVLPPTVMGYYLLVALGGASPVGQWLQSSFGISLTFNFTGLLLASVVFNIPFMLQPIQRAFESIPHNLNEAAQVWFEYLGHFHQGGIALGLAWSVVGHGTDLCSYLGRVWRGADDWWQHSR